MMKTSDLLAMARKDMTRRGFQVVIEGDIIRFVGATDETEQDVLQAIDALKVDDSSNLTELLEDMGMTPDVKGTYLIASAA